jgi:hypothetical protein
MLQIIKRATSLESHADGGSLSISFEGYFGKKFCLSFPAPLQRPGNEGSPVGTASAAFLPPVLDIFSAVKQKNQANGDINIDWNKETKAISWRDARKLLRKLRRHVIGRGSGDQHIYEAMLHASRNDGRA